MQIHQLNVSHNDRQDRLLLRLNTQTGQEFRFWLTRRLTLRLMPVLLQTVGRMESNTPQMVATDPASQQILSDLKRDAFLQQADFKTPFSEQAQQLPLGDAPMLVTDVHLQLMGMGMQLTLEDKDAASGQTRSCQLQLQASLVHGLIHLLQQASSAAHWQANSPADASSPMQEAGLAPVTGYRH